MALIILIILVALGAIVGTVTFMKIGGKLKFLRLPDFQEPTWQRIQWISLLLFMIATLVFVVLITHFEISTAQHVWCHVINTLNSAPAPKNVGPPAQHAYGMQLAHDFAQLKGQLGC